MTSPVATVGPDNSAKEAARLPEVYAAAVGA
jgi:hypothetical protein